MLILISAGAIVAAAQQPLPTPTRTPATLATPLPSPTPDDPMPVQRSFDKPLPPLPDPGRIGVRNDDELSLTIDQAVEMALKNNNDIDAFRDSNRIAEYNLRAFQGVYDPLFSSQTYYQSASTPTASTIGGAVNGKVTQKQFFNDFGLSGLTRTGGTYSATFNESRTNTSNRNATLNPQYPTNLIANLTQPLWRNRSIDQNRRQILIAKKNVNLTDSQFRQRAMDVVQQVEQAYWDLVYQLRNLQVQNDALKEAREQLESNRRMVERGALAPIDIVQAQAQIATFEQAVYTAQESVTRAENTLKTLLLPERTAAEWSRPIMPVTPINQDVPRVGLETATADALKNRPEIEQLDISAQINQIDQRFYRNQTKPQIDLFSTYTAAGLAGTPNPLSSGFANVPDLLKGGYFNSLRNLLGQDFPTYRAGIQISFPLRNRVAEANLARSQVEEHRIGNNRAQEEQIVEMEVRNALQALRSQEAAFTAAASARQAAEELYASEERQFRGGTTTFYLVLQRQNELNIARARELQARTNLNRSISTFNRATGRTLIANNVTLR